jgi:hypothetical protein
LLRIASSVQTSHGDDVLADNPIEERIWKAIQKSTTGITVDNGIGIFHVRGSGGAEDRLRHPERAANLSEDLFPGYSSDIPTFHLIESTVHLCTLRWSERERLRMHGKAIPQLLEKSETLLWSEILDIESWLAHRQIIFRAGQSRKSAPDYSVSTAPDPASHSASRVTKAS